MGEEVEEGERGNGVRGGGGEVVKWDFSRRVEYFCGKACREVGERELLSERSKF